MLQEWEKHHPGHIMSLATSLRNVVPSHLGDSRLFNFTCLEPAAPENEDEEDIVAPIRLMKKTYIDNASRHCLDQ
jgi:tRNA 2-thiocytidine biosynthesis protein TtcA